MIVNYGNPKGKYLMLCILRHHSHARPCTRTHAHTHTHTHIVIIIMNLQDSIE